MDKRSSSVIFLRYKFNTPSALYFLIFGVSGFAGLIYESIWSHYLKLFLGHAAYAQSLVLIIFMGGMALGAWLASRYLINRSSPLLFYAAVELIIGLAGLFFHDSFVAIIEVFYASLLASTGSPIAGATLKWAVASILIMPQSVLLGMTFPLMSTGVIRRYPDTPGSTIAMLYFTNSIGAAAGVLASGFWLIGSVGLPGTILTAGLLNIVLAVVVWIVVRLDPPVPAPFIKQQINSSQSLSPAMLFLFSAFITGTASFIYEIGWIRMLNLVLGSTTHSFELILSAFIAGLGLGGLWIKNRLDRITSPMRFAGYVQLIMGALALLTIPIYVHTFHWMEWALQALDYTDAGYDMYKLVSHSLALLVMLPTTFMAGMTLPLFTYALIRQGHGEKSIGQVYAANTIGAILGVIFAIQIGLPHFGLKHLIVVGAALDIGLGLLLLFRQPAQRARKLEYAAGGLIGIGVLILTITTISLPQSFLISGVFRTGTTKATSDHQVNFYRDGKTATIYTATRKDGTIVLGTNGKPDASIRPNEAIVYDGDEVTQTLLGALPIAYMPDATHVAVIGMGSGLTTHALLTYEGIQKVDTIEIETAVVDAATVFGQRVERTYLDPRSQIHIEDAKAFFSLNNKKYDIIIAEPSNPWVSGVASLFTTEFYKAMQRYLIEDGLFGQWIQLYEFDDALMESILKALSSAFSDYVIYRLDAGNIMLIAKNSGQLSEPDWASLFSSPITKELNKINVNSKSDLLLRKLISAEHLDPYLMGSSAPMNSDYFPYVDLNAGRARFTKSVAGVFNTWSVASVPILEMLGGATWDHTRVSSAPIPGLYTAHMEARWIYHQLTTDLSSEVEVLTPERAPNSVSDEQNSGFKDIAGADNVSLGNHKRLLSAYTMYQTILLRQALSSCALGKSIPGFRLLVHNIMSVSLPYLNPDSGTSLINTIAAANCTAQNDAQVMALFDLYRAVARRDETAMSSIARYLLEDDAKTSADLLPYLVAAAMLGDLTADEPERALELWNRHSKKLFLTIQSARHMDLLTQLAGYPN
ncbi:MAG: spermidine synthase [Pseudomonadota bacterium]|nr:spermidine synthase [Pseudomonadota bacterium]